MSPIDLLRRPSAPIEPAAPRATVAERVVARTAGFLSGGQSRRRFLARTAVVGSAIAVNPVTYLLKPGTAYGAVCGTCSDGWTAFCCTINNGSNSCPPATFVAGWWKADGSAYCSGGPRYIIDCNATCPTQCSCRCAGAACDGRRTCCNQFRYGQCNQQISCFGPVACRVAICITPWTYDPACSTRTLTDNRTADHGAACLTSQSDTPIGRKHQALGGNNGILGRETQSERATPDGTGRYAIYTGGRIYDSPATEPQEIHGSLLDLWLTAGATGSAYGYPIGDVSTANGNVRFSRFQRGAIYRFANGTTYGVPAPFYPVYQQYGGLDPDGLLGYPTSAIKRSGDNRTNYINFQKGRIYQRGSLTPEIHGAIFDKHEALDGIYGPLGHVKTSVATVSDGRGRFSTFEGGDIYYTAQTGAHGLWGDVLVAYRAFGGPTSDLGYPTSDRGPVGDGRGTRVTTERAGVYATSTTGAHVVPAAVFARWTGGPTGSFGYPTAAPQRLPGSGYRQTFENGTITASSPFVPYVKATYEDFLDRAPTAAEVDYTATALGNGLTTRAAHVRSLAASDAYISALVQGLYQDTLGRAGSGADVAFWVDRIRRGESVAKVASFFYSSAEYYEGIGGGTDRSWVADLYDKVLGRPATTDDVDYWSGQVPSRGRTRVALALYQSGESRAARVQTIYQALLGRAASSADASYWSARILTQGDLSLASTIAAMQEYFDRSQSRFPS